MSAPTLGELDLLLLGAVARLGGEGYGVAIRQEVADRTGREIAIGSVYRSLGALERKGLVLSRQGDPTPVRGGRAKRYFEVTTQGVAALGRALRDLRAVTEDVALGWEPA